MEFRMQESSIEVGEDGVLIVSGYVNKTGQLSNMLGKTKRFYEKISKGAFKRAIATKGEIDFLSEHDNSKILSSTRNNSLKLVEDDEGLFMTAEITPTSYGKDAYELIKAGIFKNMSFGFRSIKDSWKLLSNGIYERTVEELELFEVSVVKNPAYSQSTIAARGIDLNDIEIPQEIIQEERDLDEIKEILKSLETRMSEFEEKLNPKAEVVVEEDVENREIVAVEMSVLTSLKDSIDNLKSEILWMRQSDIWTKKEELQAKVEEVVQLGNEIAQAEQELEVVAEQILEQNSIVEVVEDKEDRSEEVIKTGLAELRNEFNELKQEA